MVERGLRSLIAAEGENHKDMVLNRLDSDIEKAKAVPHKEISILLASLLEGVRQTYKEHRMYDRDAGTMAIFVSDCLTKGFRIYQEKERLR